MNKESNTIPYFLSVMQRVSVFPGYQPLSQKLRNEQIEEESELPAATLEEEKKLLTEHEDKEKYFSV